MSTKNYTIWILGFLLAFTSSVFAGMKSDNYQITTSVASGGGAPMTSTNYQMDSTQGQPSPLMDPIDPPYSSNYWLYPGFWYTLEAGLIPDCNWDFEPDGDVDGMDLATFGDSPFDESDLATFASEFGRTNCLD